MSIAIAMGLETKVSILPNKTVATSKNERNLDRFSGLTMLFIACRGGFPSPGQRGIQARVAGEVGQAGGSGKERGQRIYIQYSLALRVAGRPQ